MIQVLPLTDEQKNHLSEITKKAVSQLEVVEEKQRKYKLFLSELSNELNLPVDVLNRYIAKLHYDSLPKKENVHVSEKNTGKSHLYIHKVGDNAIKVGKSVNVSNRFIQQQRKSIHKMENILDIEFDNTTLPNSFEADIKLLGTKLGLLNGFLPKDDFFDGYTETYPLEMLHHAVEHIKETISVLPSTEYAIVNGKDTVMRP